MSEYDAIIVGAGAAGCVAAGFAAKRGRKILLLERNPRPARKILVTGKGRCNLTNDCPPEEFLRHVRSNARFLTGAISRFPPSAAIELFESLGVPLKTERGRRVFPVSDKAMDIADALQRLIHEKNITRAEGRAVSLRMEDGVLAGIRTEDGAVYSAQSVLIATGGMTYPATGSTGDGYDLARQAGHTVTELRPSLVGVLTEENFSALEGLSLKNVKLGLFFENKKKPVYEENGEMLFTRYGVSGPLVLTASAYMSGPCSDYRMEIDWKPGLSAEELDRRILRDFSERQNRDFINALDALLPSTAVPFVVGQSEIPGTLKVHQITKEQRAALVSAIKSFRVTPKTLDRMEGAVVTAGGVSVREVNPKTMESKLLPGLYFAGEVLDVDAETGGYNLQIAFATGFCAGNAI